MKKSLGIAKFMRVFFGSRKFKMKFSESERSDRFFQVHYLQINYFYN